MWEKLWAILNEVFLCGFMNQADDIACFVNLDHSRTRVDEYTWQCQNLLRNRSIISFKFINGYGMLELLKSKRSSSAYYPQQNAQGKFLRRLLLDPLHGLVIITVQRGWQFMQGMIDSSAILL